MKSDAPSTQSGCLSVATWSRSQRFRWSTVAFPWLLAVAAGLSAVVGGCRGGPSAVLGELIESHRLAADLRVVFNKAADASNRAVMADKDEVSVAFAHEAEQLRASVAADVASLGPRLQGLGLATATQALDEFRGHFGEYEKLDRGILRLAVENTNLKAQRLSFGAAREAAEGFRAALSDVAAQAPAKNRCQVDSLVSAAVLAVREIQVLQGPHIAEAESSVMARLEGEMAAAKTKAQEAMKTLKDLPQVAGPKTAPAWAAAAAALDRFGHVSAEIVRLSRRNSNVRSLDLALRQKPSLTASCDESLRVLQESLAKEASTATR